MYGNIQYLFYHWADPVVHLSFYLSISGCAQFIDTMLAAPMFIALKFAF